MSCNEANIFVCSWLIPDFENTCMKDVLFILQQGKLIAKSEN